MSDERTLPASPRRRQEVRRQGHHWQSRELSAALMTGGAGLLLMWQGPAVVDVCAGWLQQSLITSPVLKSGELATAWQRMPLSPLGLQVAGLLLGMWLLAVLVRLIQVGPVWAPGLVLPRPERVAPTAGLRRMFSSDAFVRGPIWLLRLIVVAAVVWWTLPAEVSRLSGGFPETPSLLPVLAAALTSFAVRLCGGLLLVAAVDVGWQWWSFERQLRMSPAELRAEQRESNRQTPPGRRRPSLVSHPAAEPISGV